MSDLKDQSQFLEDLATQYKFYGDTRTAFLGRFAQENADKQNNQLRLTWTKDDLVNKEQKIQDELKKIYPALRENGCDIPDTNRGRYKKGESPWELAYKWLWEVKFLKWKSAQTEIEKPSEILKRCVLGLKGNYQEAQQKITEITQHLQTLLKDDTLSITVEEGSIIIIVESSQTDYAQIKTRLIGQKIAGFPVEYVIDEWQDVCRKMLKSQTQLSSNSVLRRAYCNRNLIEEELFVDLGLVQPKKDRDQAHQQDIEPHRGSEFYTRQEEAVEKRFAYPEFLKEVISKRTQKNIAIIGEPGAGKTTLLQKLAFWLLQETDDLVIWIPLRDLGDTPLEKYLQENWRNKAFSSPTEKIKADWEQKVKGGAVWLLLDGLDEMGDKARNTLSFQGWVTQAQLIISCRLNLWQVNPVQLQRFQTYLTQPFQNEQIQQFIQKWFQGLSGEKQELRLAESLWEALQTSGKERIQDLCRNPLRLTLLCSIWQGRKGDLPDTTAKLYEKFVDYIYEWKKKEFPVTDEERKRLNAGLGKLAKASLDGEGTRFRLTHRFVCKYLGKPDNNSLLDTALKLGWLNEVGVDADEPEDPVYAFYHATFQEYFAALAVDDWDYFLPRNHVNFPVEGKEYRIFEPQWKQVILLWLGREDIADKEKEKFIEKLVNFEDGCGEWNFEKVDRGFYGYRAYFLAAAGINEFKECSLSDAIVKQIVKWGFSYFDRTFLDLIAEGAKTVLPETIRKSAINHLIQVLETTKNEYTPRIVADSLGKIAVGNELAIGALIRVLEMNKDEWNRQEVADNLGKIAVGSKLAIGALLRVLETTENKKTRGIVADSLGKIAVGNELAIRELIRVLETTKNKYTRRIVANILGKIPVGNELVIRELIRVSETTEDKDTRRSVANILDKITVGNELANGELIRVENEDILWSVADSLGEIAVGNELAIGELIRVLETTKDEDTRRSVADSLGKIAVGNELAIRELIRVLETTEDEDTRWWVVEILGQIAPGNELAIVALIRVLETTEDEDTRRSVADSLGKIAVGNELAIRALIRVLETTKNEYTRREVADSLGQIIKTKKHYADVVFTLNHNLTNEVYKNNFNRFEICYEFLWQCAENLTYPRFYQAWHYPPTTPHPEVTERTPVGNNSTIESLETQQINISGELKNLPIFCLKAHILATETRESEIAKTLCRLIWKQALPNQRYPQPTTPADLCYELDELKLTLNLSKLAILLTECETPTPELIAFCHKLTDTVDISWLTDEPLEVPLKGFPPHQPNLLSAIQTWLEET